ncbi:MAG: hydrogenase 4 subunit B, partial [Burkholderiales bacterium]|nr:hydrogenase 4 subunit B [Burkholderiales bacterium]
MLGAWLAIGIAGLFALRRFKLVAQRLFPIGGAIGIGLFGAAMVALFSGPQTAELVIGLPGLPFHLRLDALSAFFLMIIGAVSAGVSAFAAGYFRHGEGTPPGLLCLQYHVFLASMAGVVLADDAYAFMVMWETMALSSFFLVTANHRIAEIRRAGTLYLIVAHIGAIAILLCFGVLQANTGDYSFANMRAQHLSPFWASVAFLLALLGFGAKAGLLPLHIWLPEAHPAAPSPVSALMSAVMLKTAIYGLLRVTFDLLHQQQWWWGVVMLAVGLATAIFGVVFAAAQTDMKRLLAYSSIENIGLIGAGMGLALVFSSYSMRSMAALALTATLYHAASHAFFKSLLFVSTGAVMHSTDERSLGHLGGLIRYMPWVAWVTLAGVLASAGLPPTSGFAAEWLLLQSFLFTPGLPDPFLNMLVPVGAALIAMVGALAGYVMVKFYGVVFLGQPREAKLAQARDAGRWERRGMRWLLIGGVLLGLFPIQFIQFIDPVTRLLTGAGIGPQVAANGWLLAPTAVARASYSPVIFLLGVAGSFAIA